MLAGVKILLERMKSNPEDFHYSVERVTTKWMRLIDHSMGSEMLTQEERDALNEGLKNVRREIFTQRVMETLAGEDSQEGESSSPFVQARGTTLGGASLAQMGALSNLSNASNGYYGISSQQAMAQNTFSPYQSNGTTTTLTLGQESITDIQLREMKRMVEDLKKEQKKAQEKSTILGYLKNWSNQ